MSGEPHHVMRITRRCARGRASGPAAWLIAEGGQRDAAEREARSGSPRRAVSAADGRSTATGPSGAMAAAGAVEPAYIATATT